MDLFRKHEETITTVVAELRAWQAQSSTPVTASARTITLRDDSDPSSTECEVTVDAGTFVPNSRSRDCESRPRAPIADEPQRIQIGYEHR